jgi:hypothetical protein
MVLNTGFTMLSVLEKDSRSREECFGETIGRHTPQEVLSRVIYVAL